MDKELEKKILSKESLPIYNFVIKTKNMNSSKDNIIVKRVILNEDTIKEDDENYPSSINFA